MNDNRDVVIVSAVRTPIGAYCGLLRDVPVEKLAAKVIDEALKRTQFKPEDVEEVILGQSFPNGETPNLARLAPQLGAEVEIEESVFEVLAYTTLDRSDRAAGRLTEP